MSKVPTVSIVIPVYNAERFIAETIKTCQEQSFNDWEAIFVDDKSTDKSAAIIEKESAKDGRIKLTRNEVNSRAGVSRNNGVKMARGRYVAFLDADDLWHPEKLERQLEFIMSKSAAFVCTGYEFANENGSPTGKRVSPPARANYRDMLTNVTTWTSTTMFDMTQLSKEDISMPDIKRGQDAATWWKVLKKVEYVYGLSDTLAYYRRTNTSLSANKLKALQRTWYLYRHIEKINPVRSLFYLTQHTYNATKRRI